MLKDAPKTIQIFLPKGDPRGIRVAEITTSIVRVIEVPRNLLNDFIERPEALQVGLYFLIGDEDETGQGTLYIGQTGELKRRLAGHNANKDFWTRALIVVSLTHSLTNTHALYLEWLCLQQAAQAERYRLLNGTVGSRPHTPEPLQADCNEIFNILGVLSSTLGHHFFERVARFAPNDINSDWAEGEDRGFFYCRSSGADAIGEYTSEGFVVFKGSKARKDPVDSIKGTSFGLKRLALIEEGTLQLQGEVYELQKDCLFSSPSAAATAMMGRASNGWIDWKQLDGKTLHDVKRAPAKQHFN